MLDELLKPYENQYGIFAMTPGDLREFAEKIASAEREACAKMCEEYNTRQAYNDEDMEVANECAQAIRARSER